MTLSNRIFTEDPCIGSLTLFWNGIKGEDGYPILQGKFTIDYFKIKLVCVFVLMNSNNSHFVVSR